MFLAPNDIPTATTIRREKPCDQTDLREKSQSTLQASHPHLNHREQDLSTEWTSHCGESAAVRPASEEKGILRGLPNTDHRFLAH